MATIPRGCCSHCKYKDCEMKMQYLALEKENMRLRDEIDKTNAQIGCRVLKLSDYCYMKEKLKYDIDETKKRLQKTVKQKDSILRQKNRILREKDNAIQKKLKELESLNAKCLRHNAFCTSLQEANLKINNLEEEKNLLTSELDNMTKEQNKWCNSAKERAQVIAEFLKANMQIVDYNSWKATMSLSEELQAVKGSLDDNTADLMFLKQSLQTTSEACQNCQTSFLEQKTLLEEKILQLENQIVNDSFLQNQQSEMIKKLTQKNEDYKKRGVKRIKKELLSPTGDMNLPPTPSTPDQDMYQNNEFEDEESSKLKQNSQTANCPQTMLCSVQVSSEDINRVDDCSTSFQNMPSTIAVEENIETKAVVHEPALNKKPHINSKTKMVLITMHKNSPKENASNSIETGDIKVSPSSPMNPVVLRVNTKEVTMSDEDISVLSPRPVEIFETQKQVSRVSSRGETVDSKTKCSVELDQTILFNKRKNSTEEKVLDSSEKTDSYGIKALQSFKKPVLPVDEEMCDEDHPISSPSPVKMPGTQKAHSMVSPEIGALNNKTKLSVKSDEIGLEESTQASSNDQVINNKIQSPEYLEIIDILSEVTQIPSILSPIRPLKVKCDKRPIELNLQTDYPKRRKTLFSPTHSSNLSEFPVLCDLRKDLVDLSPEPVETFIEVKPKNSCGEENKSPKPSVIKKERKPGSDSHTASEIEATPKPSVIIKERKPGSDSHTASEIEAAPKPSVIKKERRPGSDSHTASEIEATPKPSVIIKERKPGSDSHTASEIEAAPKPSVIRKERKPGRDSHTASEIEAAPKPSVIKKERKPSSDSHTASEIEAVKKECYVVLEDINHISEKNEKSPCLNQTSQGLKFVDKQMSKLTPNTPDTITEVSKNVDLLLSSPKNIVKSKKVPREVQALLSQNSLFTSFQSYDTEARSPQRSPTSLARYELRLSPKMKPCLQYYDVSSSKAKAKSCTIKTSESTNRRNSKTTKSQTVSKSKTTKTKDSHSSTKKTIPHSPTYTNHLFSPRSPEAMKHYNMRSLTSQQVCEHCTSSTCVGAENFVRNPNKKRKSSGVKESHRPEQSTALVDITCKIRPIKNNISENEINVRKEDVELLATKLKMSPQNRMELLKQQENLVNKIEINTKEKQPAKLRCYTLENKKNENRLDELESNSITAGLLKISETSLTDETEDPLFTKSVQSFAEEPNKDINYKPDIMIKTCFREEQLIMKSDVTIKSLCYQSNWHDLYKSRKYQRDSKKRSILSLNILKINNTLISSRMDVKRINRITNSQKKHFLTKQMGKVCKKHKKASKILKKGSSNVIKSLQMVIMNPCPKLRFNSSISTIKKDRNDAKVIDQKQRKITVKAVQTPEKVLQEYQNSNSLITPEAIQKVNLNKCPVQSNVRKLRASNNQPSDAKAIVYKQHNITAGKEVQSSGKLLQEFKNPNTLQASERLQREDLNSCPVQSLAKSLSTSKDKPSSAKDIVRKQHNIEAEKEVKPSEKLLQEIKKSNSLSTREAKSRVSLDVFPVQSVDKSISPSDAKAIVLKQHDIPVIVQSPGNATVNNLNSNSLQRLELLQRINLDFSPVPKFGKSASASRTNLSDLKSKVHKKHVINAEKEVSSPKIVLEKNGNRNSLPTPELLQRVKLNPCSVQRFTKSTPASRKEERDVRSMVHKQHVIIDKEVQSPRKAEDNNLYSYSLPTPELLPKVNPNPIPMQRFKKSSSASIQRLIDEKAMVHKQPVIIDKEVQAPRKAKQNNLNSYPLSTPELLPRVNPNPSPMQRFKKSSSASMQKLSDEKAMVHKHVITTENEVQSPRKILKKNENCNSLPTPELLQRVNLKSIPMQKFRKSSSVSIQKLSDEKAMVHKHVITTEKEVQSPRKILKKNENCNSLPTPELLQMVKQNPCPVQDFNKSLPASTKNLSDVELTKEPRITEVKEIQSIDSQILRNRESFPAAEDADESDEDCLSIFVDDKLLSPPVETEYSSHSLDGEIIPQRINTEFKKDKAFDGVGGSKLTDDSKRERTTSTESAKTATSYIHWTPNLVYDAGIWVKANTSMTSIMSGAEASFKSESPEIQNSSSTVYLPNFYAEHKDAIENDQEATSLETVTQKDDKVDDRKVSNNYISQITLDKIVPKGDKVKVEETVLRTVVNKSNNEWATYKERNQTEERNIQAQIHVPANQTEKATKIIQPLFTTVLKSIVDIVKIANELECFSLRVILKAVLVLLHKFSSEHTEENPTAAWMHKAVYNVTLPNKRSPFVHPKIQALLLLLHMIIDKFTNEKNAEEKRKFVEEGLYFMELAFLDTILEFRQSKAIFWLTIGMIYTILARHYGFLARVRKLMYDMFYCFTRRSLVVAHAMLLLWPSVLPPKPIEFYSDDPLRLCIIRQLTSPPKFNQVGPNVHIRNLQRFMMTKYRYKEDTVDPEKLFNLCMEHLEQQGVYKAAVLMIKRQPPEWFLGRPYKELLDKVRSWWKGGEECSDVEAVNAVNILCTALRPQDILCPKVQTELRRTLSLLEDILLDEWTPIWMQEVIVKNICLLTRLNHVECLKTIVKWKPSEVSEDVVDHIHHDVINKQTKEWWTSAVGSSFLRPS